MTVNALRMPLEIPHASDAAIGALYADLDYLASVVRLRLRRHLSQETTPAGSEDLPRPHHDGTAGPYLEFLARHRLSGDQHLLLLLALVPHVRPELLDRAIAEALPQGGDFPQIGGVRGKQYRGFLPTGETALFLLADGDAKRRAAMQRLLASERHDSAESGAPWVETAPAGEPAMSGRLMMDPELIELFTLGQASPPAFGMDFPAKRIATEMTWDDLVLPPATSEQVGELKAWVEHGDTLLFDWGMSRRLKRGFRALFHGPPGTGKTLTAALLGKYTGRDVYRVDLSMVVSKFIGETEKNLASLFNKAEHKDWILFFDEADALFGKRTNVRDAHDRYANQEIAYLLQRVEDYAGLVILASNFKNNIDDAFLRRFQAAVHFPVPAAAERSRLWRLAFPPAAELEPEIDLDTVARQYELAGGHIMNVVQYACLRALDRGERRIRMNDLNVGIRREVSKDGKTL